MTNSMWDSKTYGTVLACFTLVGIIGCGAGARTENVTPGDPDYPVLNSTPQRIVTVTGTLPKSLAIEFKLLYIANEYIPLSEPLNSQCSFLVAAGSAKQTYYLVENLPIKRTGDSYTASINVDKYLEGRCGWHLATLSYQLPHGEGMERDFIRPAVAYFNQDTQTYYEGPVDIWCETDPNAPNSKFYIVCSDFVRVDSSLGQLTNRIQAIAKPTTTALEINFHMTANVDSG